MEKEIILDNNMNKDSILDNNNFNEEITFIEKKVVEERFPDNILENILVNEFLKEYPVYLQSDKTIQNEVFKKVQSYIQVYHVYKNIIKDNNYIYNSYYEDIKSNNLYKVPWIIPVVIDIKRTYSLFCEGESNKKDTVIYEVLEDFKKQYFQLYQLEKQYYNNTISLVRYNQEKRSIIESYIIPSDNFLEENNIPLGKKITLDEYTNIIRYSGIDKYITSRVGRGKEMMGTYDSNSTHDKKYITTETGESLYIVGLYYLPKDTSIHDPYTKIEIQQLDNMNFHKPYFITFPKRTKKKSNITDIEYQDILHKCIPSYKKILAYTLSNNYTYEDIIQYIQWWGYSINNIDIREITKLYRYKEKESIDIQPLLHIIESDFVDKKLIQKIPEYKNIPNVSIDHIYNYTSTSFDNGNLFYIFLYFLHFYKKQDSKIPLQTKKEYVPFDTKNILEKLEKKEITFSEIKNYITKNPFSLDIQEENEIIKKTDIPIEKIDIEKKIQKYVTLYKKIEFSRNYKDTHIISSNTINIIPPLESKKTEFIMKYINSLSSISQKKKLLYKIIELDGIIINKYVYSTYYKEPLCCGHWYYYYKMENSKDLSIIDENNKILLSLYSDNDKEQNNCNVCGGYLQIKDYDEGYIYESSIQYNIETIKVPYKHLIPSTENEIVSDNIRNPKSDEFISYISMEQMYSKEEKIQASIACNLLDTITKKLGLDIPNKHFIDIVITCTKERKRIQNYEKYSERRVSNYQKKKKISNSKIEKLVEEGSFKKKIQKSYRIYYMTQYGTLIISHLLWYLRCSFPTIVPKNDNSGCSFTSFDDEEGLYYMLCVTMNLKLLYFEYNDEGNIIRQSISKEKTHQSILFWTSILQYKYEDFYHRKKEKEIQENTKIIQYDSYNVEEIYNWKDEQFNFINEYGLYIYKKDISILEHINNIIISFKKLKHIDNNNIFTSNEILEAIQKNEKVYNTIFSYLKSQNILYNNKKNIKNVYNTKYSVVSIPIEIKKNIFLSFCYEGTNKGKLHNFYNILEKKKCVYCKKYYDELESQKYTEKEYSNAYSQIQNHNIKEYNNIITKKLYNVSVLKKDSSTKKVEKIIKNISSLISKKCSYPNKKKIETDIISFFRNIKDFSNILYKDTKQGKEEDTIYTRFILQKQNQYIKNYTIRKLQTYINIYFRKSIQRIKNGYKIPKKYLEKIQDKENKILQTHIENEYRWLEPFLVENNKKIFSKFVFNFSKDMINNIKGKTHVFDKDYLLKIDTETVFSTKDVIQFLIFYLASEIQLFINISRDYSSIFADFCVAMIEEIKKDIHINTIDKEYFEKWKNQEREKFIISQLKHKDMTSEQKDENYNPLEVDRFTLENQLIKDKKYQEQKEKEEYYSENVEEDKEEYAEKMLQEEDIQNSIDRDNFEDTSIEISDSLENNNDVEDYEYEKNEDSIYTESIKSYIIDNE